MKFKTLLLAGLSTLALASCGGAKGYSNSVKQSVFLEQVTKLFTDNAIINPDKAYSYVATQTRENSSVDRFIKNGKELSKETNEVKINYTYKYDSANFVINQSGSMVSKYVDSYDKKDENYNIDTTIQCDDKYIYEINNKSKLYDKSSSSTPSDDVEDNAISAISAFKAGFLAKATNVDYNYYIDNDKVYTIEEKYNEDSSSKTKIVKNVYQFVINKEGFEYYANEYVEVNELNERTVDKSSISFAVNKKNVNLKKVNLDNYLED